MSGHGVGASLIVLVVGLLIGGLAVHVGSKAALKSRDYEHAVVTALLGAVAWAIVDYLLGLLSVSGRLGSIVGLLVWIWVVGKRYRVGWFRAALIGLVAWLAALVVLALLPLFGVGGLGAYGVPGV